MWLLYQLAMAVAMLAAAPFLLLRRGRHYLATLGGRLGRYPERGDGRAPLWIHAVSVGEVAVAATVARALPAEVPLVVTTVTPTGQARARALLGERASIAYLPLELGFAVRSFYRRFRPAALVLVEGDLWPLVLREARRRGVPVAVVNGRVSERSYRRMRWLRRWLGPLLGPVERFGVQTDADRDRLLALGVAPPRVRVTGNLKFDSPAPAARPELDALVRRLAGGRPLLVAGSTMDGEEGAVLDAFAAAGGGERALLVLAPRHPERWPDVGRLVGRRRLALTRRSEPAGGERPAVLLLDSLGELAAIYRDAAGSFIGGTLVPTGGHNPLEAARFGVPIAVGPSMHNFAEIAHWFDAADAWCRVADAAELGAAWQRWLDRPEDALTLGERGRRLVEANGGALADTLELLAPIVEPLATAGAR